MRPSLNEIEALTKRASRGAGLSWGLAEEASKAARWLVSADLPGPELLVSLLELNDGVPSRELAPIAVNKEWEAPRGRLCPVATGAVLSDYAHRLSGGSAVTMKEVSYPLLLLPAVANCARIIASPIRLSWGTLQLCTDGKGVKVRGCREQLYVSSTSNVCCIVEQSEREHWGELSSIHHGLRMMQPAGWERLLVLAARGYAPVTDESRLRGAGAA